MLTLFEQITAASGYAMRESALRAEEANAKAERQAEIRAKQWATRKAGGTGVTEALLKRLPTTRETAVSLVRIKQLLGEMKVPDSSISGSLSILVKAGRVARVGECRDYRYYLSGGDKS